MGSIQEGFRRVAHLRRAALPGGDAAAQFPVQAAAGFLAQVEELPHLSAPPFAFPARYQFAIDLVRKQVRTFVTSSMGRLFDTAAALLGFTREVTFEGQAAMWLEQLARKSPDVDAYEFPFVDSELDFRLLLRSVAVDRARARDPNQIARAFQAGIAHGVARCLQSVCKQTTSTL